MFGVLFYCLFFFIVSVICSLAPTHLHVNRVGPCYDTPDTIASISELSISSKSYDSVLSGQLIIKKNISNGWTIKGTMLKCQDLRNLDTCDYFKSFFVIKNGCSGEDDDSGETTNMFFHFTEPRLKCPIKAGKYKINRYPFFAEDNYLSVSESKISTSMFGYTFTMEGFSGRAKILCVEAYLKLVYMRIHNWVSNKDDAKKKNSNNKDDKDDSTERR